MVARLFLLAIAILGAWSVRPSQDGHADKETETRHPAIVAKVAVTGSTNVIPQTAVFTPSETGLYRLSGYMETSVPYGQGNGSYNVSFYWTDGEHVQGVALGVQSMLGPAQINQTFIARAGTPVLYSTYTSFTPTGNYDLFFTIEKLE